MSKFLAVFVLLVGSLSALAGELDVKARTYYRLPKIDLTVVGDLTLVDSTAPLTQAVAQAKAVGVIRVDTEASNVEMTVSGSDRKPIQPTKITENIWLIDQPGTWWVDVTVIDFEKNIYGRKQVLIEVGGNPGPGPDPNPPDPNPPTPTPDNVPNEYGVGKVAFQYAPAYQRSEYANIYKRAADFLYGVPSLKFIVSSNSSQSNDPNRSVLAWIRQQQELVQCTDEATCEAWKVWRDKVGLALVESQKKRQFTKQDWFNALNEISSAVRMQKQ